MILGRLLIAMMSKDLWGLNSIASQGDQNCAT
jgi:hypothetical protein